MNLNIDRIDLLFTYAIGIIIAFPTLASYFIVKHLIRKVLI